MSTPSGWLLELPEPLRRDLESEAAWWGTNADELATRILSAHCAQPVESRLPTTFLEQGAAS